ncbi:MAG TPA: 1-acyl-sn-glycerol-3-phosphate acyltransferase [Polyangiaceae bacterium]|nr:1-acyl-sn-glycerol-3-phosphate acyltransferase [Polyangiaceae bacterium]
MQPPIFSFNRSRESIVREVVSRACEGIADPRLVLSEAAFLEVRRQQASGDDDVVPLAEWRTLARSLARMSDDDCLRRVRDLAERYASDIAGNFDRQVYKVASRAVAPLIGMLMSPMQTVRHLGGAFDLRALDGRVVVQGPIGTVRALTEVGTVIYVPTHLSNLDSVVFGFALERVGLPPATYGAGKNLFTNPVLSFFMHNLGAYRVDRRLKHDLYKEVLKAYSCVILERGYHSLFFPGGTRSRSGAIERKLKLGLAGTGVEAMARTAARGETRQVFFVPATINYLLTLEAETLIDDFLQEEGRHRYIIDDDESTRPRRIASFMRKLLGLDAGCVVRFGQPLDCFGNRVDEEGTSYDARGHAVSAISYLTDVDGEVGHDPEREAQYTRELGDSIVAAYRSDTVALATHLVAACAFERLKDGVRGDIFAMLRTRDDVTVSRADLADAVEQLRDRARDLESHGRIVLGPRLGTAGGREILDEALRAFSGYHTTPVLLPRGEDLVLADTRLIFYYQNRLAAHGLGADVVRTSAPSTPGGRGRNAPAPSPSSPAVGSRTTAS